MFSRSPVCLCLVRAVCKTVDGHTNCKQSSWKLKTVAANKELEATTRKKRLFLAEKVVGRAACEATTRSVIKQILCFFLPQRHEFNISSTCNPITFD